MLNALIKTNFNMRITLNSTFRAAWAVLAAVMLCFAPMGAGAQSIGSQLAGKWAGDVDFTGMGGAEGFGNCTTEFDFEGTGNSGTVTAVINLPFSQPVSEHFRISGNLKFTTPGTWAVVDGGVYISMKNADTKMRMEDFDAQPVDETDAQTVAAIVKMKSDGFLKKIEEQVSKPLFKSFSEEFGKKGESHLQFKNVKISGGVMTLTEAEVGDMTLKRVGD